MTSRAYRAELARCADGNRRHRSNPESATRLLWRSDSCLQLELGDRAVLVDGPAARAVRRLASRRDPAGSERAARVIDRADPILRALADAGFLWPRGAAAADDGRFSPPVPRLAGELGALSARRGERAAELLAARRYASVVVSGTGRAGPQVAALLGAAGVGRVHVTEPALVRLHHSAPGGVLPADEGRSLTTATSDAVHRAAPETDTGPLSPDDRPDLVVIARDEPIDPDQRAALHRRGAPHLAVRIAADHGIVGPLVIPGLTSCLRCADLHRLDRDPAWTALAVQLSVPRLRGAASEATVATMMAALAAQQALAYLDGEDPAVIDGTLEQHLPDWRIRRRGWPTHPDCDCTHGP